MTRDLPSLPGGKAFEAAARRRSFKRAAEELHVTTSAVSHQIASLEEFLGATLFLRQTRGVALTGQGAAYLNKVSNVLNELASATRQIRQENIAGPLYLHASNGFATRWLVPRLDDFNRRHPDIELHISASMEPADFVKDDVDADIRIRDGTDTELYVESFLSTFRFPVASPSLFAGRGPLRQPDDLRDYVLLHDEFGDEWKQWLELAGASRVNPLPGPRFGNCNLVMSAAMEGQGVALANGPLVIEDIAAGALMRVFDINLPSTFVYSFACLRDYLNRPRLAAFREWLTSTAKLDNIHGTCDALSRIAAAEDPNARLF